MFRLGRIHSLTRRCAAPALATLLLTVLGCQEDPASPSEVEPGPALATGAAAGALAFRQVSAGETHTCGIATDNRAYCWGSNSHGQLGDGTSTLRQTPVAVAGTLRFRRLSAGSEHTCGVTTDNRAYCWGSNYGRLGDGTTSTESLTPVAVTGGRLFRQVDAGTYHTCGVSYPDNWVYCWGANYVGQLGDGTSVDRATPVLVAGGLRFRQVAGGQEHTCGVTTTDRAFCWGSNRFGQTGDSLPGGEHLTPSLVAGGRRFSQVDAGANFTCGVITNGRTFCWGNGNVGQIGTGKRTNPLWPKTAVAGGLSFLRVNTGGEHACGETTDNRTYCWGWNLEGAIGDGTKTMRLAPVAVAGGHFFNQVSAGRTHTCAKTPAGVAYCWGSPSQLGSGDFTEHLTPFPVAGPMQ